MASQTIKYKPWDDGQARPIDRTFVLMESHYLDCLNSFRCQLLDDSTIGSIGICSVLLDVA